MVSGGRPAVDGWPGGAPPGQGAPAARVPGRLPAPIGADTPRRGARGGVSALLTGLESSGGHTRMQPACRCPPCVGRHAGWPRFGL